MKTTRLGSFFCVLWVALLVAYPATAQTTYNFEVPEQSLGRSLQQFTEQSGVQHLYVDAEIAQKPVAAVQGSLSPRQFLDRLLAGTGVNYRFVDAGTVRLFLAAPVAPQENAAPADVGNGEQGTTPTQPDMDAQVPPVMEEVIVSARKRDESLQDVPLSISAFTSTAINDAGMTSVFDIADFTPNLSFRESFGRTFDRPVVRGMSNILGGANTGIFVNGIFVPGTISNAELTSLERVEVIKGPQSALFGRATFAGAINYVTRAPGEEMRGRVLTTLAEDGEVDISGFLSGPLIKDKLGYMISARFFEMDGQYDNIGTGGGSAGGLSSDSVNLALRWTPSDRVEATLRLMYAEDDDDHIPFRLQTSSENNCFPDSALGYFCGEVNEFRDVALNLDVLPDAGLTRNTHRSSLQVDIDVGSGITLTSVSSYTDEETEIYRDNDFLDTIKNPLIFLPFLSVEAFRTFDSSSLRDVSQEFRVSSDANQPLRWLAGLYYYEEQNRGTSSSGLALDNPRRVAPREVTNKALFASAEYDFTDKLTATAEVRYAEDKIETETNSTVNGLPATLALSEDFASTTPRFTISYDVDDALMLYANASKGTKPGGFNTSLQAANIVEAERNRLIRFATFDEEEAWNFEFGAKGSALDNRVRYDVALFYVDWTQQQLSTSEQVERTGNPFSTVPLIVNAGKTRVHGAELSLQARPVHFWDIALSYGWVNAEFEQFDDLEQEDLFGDPSAKGNITPNAPEHTFSLSNTLHFALTNTINGHFRADYLFESTRYAQIHNLAETGSSEKVNLRLALKSGPWTATLFGRNVFNDRTPNSVTRFLDPQTLFSDRAFGVALPRLRQVGVSLQYDLE